MTIICHMYQYTEINAERFPHKVALCQRVLFLQGRVGDGGPRCRFRSQHSKREQQRLRFRKTQRRWCNRVFTVWAPWQRECSNLTRILEEKWTDDWRPISSDPDDCNSMMWNLFVGTMDWRNYTSVNSFHHLYKHTQGSGSSPMLRWKHLPLIFSETTSPRPRCSPAAAFATAAD